MVLKDGEFEPIVNFAEWNSPRLGIRFELIDNTLKIFNPDEWPFLTFQELDNLRKESAVKLQESEAARQRAEESQLQTASELAQERQRAESFAGKLRELGIDLQNL